MRNITWMLCFSVTTLTNATALGQEMQPPPPFEVWVGSSVTMGVPGKAVLTAFCYGNDGTPGHFRVKPADQISQPNADVQISTMGVTFTCLVMMGKLDT